MAEVPSGALGQPGLGATSGLKASYTPNPGGGPLMVTGHLVISVVMPLGLLLL